MLFYIAVINTKMQLQKAAAVWNIKQHAHLLMDFGTSAKHTKASRDTNHREREEEQFVCIFQIEYHKIASVLRQLL